MAAPGCVSEAVEMECGRSEIDELIKEVSRAACPGRHGESGASQVPRLGHRGPRAVTPARMGRVSACTSHSVLRPEGWGPAASASTELPPALDLSGFERFGWHHISPGLFQAGCSGKKPPSTSLAAGGWAFTEETKGRTGLRWSEMRERGDFPSLSSPWMRGQR